MRVLSLLVALCGLVASEAVAYYESPYVYAPAAHGYVFPAYVPPYGRYHVAPNSGAYYGGGEQEVKAQTKTYEKPQDKYYYGGKYGGSCPNDGLYYKDDTTFVICSNGYASEQPCPPGTKTSGYPTYQAGYYYGYTDLCSVNLVDYGYGPSNYVSGPAYSEKDETKTEYKDKSYANEEKKEYNSYGKESYTTAKSTSYAPASTGDAYQAPKASYPANSAYPAASASYTTKNTYAAAPRDAAGYEIKESYPSYPTANQYASTVSSYTTKAAYQPATSTTYASRSSYSNPYVPKDNSYSAGSQSYPSSDSYESRSNYLTKDTAYPSSYQSKDTYAYQAKDTVYSPRNDYVKETYASKGATSYSENRY